jgi:ornithine cyclodeaminase
MRDAALELGMAERLSLIPELADPKNLFGFIPLADAAATPHAVAKPRVRALA